MVKLFEVVKILSACFSYQVIVFIIIFIIANSVLVNTTHHGGVFIKTCHSRRCKHRDIIAFKKGHKGSEGVIKTDSHHHKDLIVWGKHKGQKGLIIKTTHKGRFGTRGHGSDIIALGHGFGGGGSFAGSPAKKASLAAQMPINRQLIYPHYYPAHYPQLYPQNYQQNYNSALASHPSYFYAYPFLYPYNNFGQ